MKSAEEERDEVRSRENQAPASKSPLPVESQLCLIPSVMSCDNGVKCYLPGKLTGNSAKVSYWALLL